MGKSSTVKERDLTQQELDLLETQNEGLKQAIEVASKQYNLSNEDREYVSRIYRGDLNPNDPKVQAEVAKRLASTPPPDKNNFKTDIAVVDAGGGLDYAVDEEAYNKALKAWEDNKATLVRKVSGELGDKGVDELLFEGVINSKTEAGKLLQGWQQQAIELGDKYTSTLGGISEKFKSTITDKTKFYESVLNTSSEEFKKSIQADTGKFEEMLKMSGSDFEKAIQGETGEYKQELAKIDELFKKSIQEQTIQTKQALGQSTDKYVQSIEATSSKMGTADADIYATTKGQNLAGISQSFAEAQKQADSALARRGISGSGVQAGVISSLAGAEAQQKAQALGQSYAQAIALSDQRRQQRMGISGQVYGAEQQFATQGGQLGLSAAQQIAQSSVDMMNSRYGAGTSSASQIAQMQQAQAQGIYGARSGMVGNIAQMQQGNAGNIYNAGMGLAGQISQSGTYTAGNLYQTGLGIQTSILQNNIASQQQNIANLQLASGVSQGIFGQSVNMLAGAGSTANQMASVAGNTASAYGQIDASYKSNMYAADQELQGAMFGAIAGGVATYAGASSGKAATGAAASDKRLKTNIVKVGESNGYNIYTWDWIEGHDYGYNIGVIAQEVMEVNPEAVILMDNGYYAVDYKAIGV